MEGASEGSGAHGRLGSIVGSFLGLAGDEVQQLMTRLADRTAKVVVVGQGYVGLTVAMRAVQVGFNVVGFEVSTERVAALRNGHSYVGDISDEEVAGALPALAHRPDDLAGDRCTFVQWSHCDFHETTGISSSKCPAPSITSRHLL